MTNPKIDSEGNKFWRNNAGECHREDGPAIEYENGDKSWWFWNKLHREDGPAFEYNNGSKVWMINGKRHRLDGPAVEYYDGKCYYYINSQQLTKNKWESHPLRIEYVIKENLKSILHE